MSNKWVSLLQTRSTLLKRLEEAEEALHELNVTGAVRTFVDQNNERVEYSVTNTARLTAYIAKLKVELGMDLGNSGAMEFYF